MVSLEKYTAQWVELGRINGENVQFQFRQEMDVAGLVESFKKENQQFPIILWNKPGGLQIICGFTRYNAARQLGWEKILAIVIPEADLTEKEAFNLSFVENMRRKQFTNLDLMFACKKLKMKGDSNEEIGALLGKSENQIRRYLKVADAPREEQQKLLAGDTTIKDIACGQIAPGGDLSTSDGNYTVKPIKSGFDASIKFRVNRDNRYTLNRFMEDMKKAMKEAEKQAQKASKKKAEELDSPVEPGNDNRGETVEGLDIPATPDAVLKPAPEAQDYTYIRAFNISGRQRIKVGETAILSIEAYDSVPSKVRGLAPDWLSRNPEIVCFKLDDGGETGIKSKAESVTVIGKAAGTCFIKANLGQHASTFGIEVRG